MKKLTVSRALMAFCLVFPLTAIAQTTSVASTAAVNLKQDMRKLWTDHVIWTRAYVVAAVDDRPEATASAARLMKNQEDIGKAVGTYYGAAAGQQLTTLLKDHINIAVDLVKAAKAGDKMSQDKANQRWQENATQIADFLSKANPHWPRAALVDMMKMHLSTTTTEVVARLKKDWEGDVRAFDALYDHILKMADALSNGIIKQFPDKFGGSRTDQ